MKHTLEFKLECVDKYRKSEYIATPGKTQNQRNTFMNYVRDWVKRYKEKGIIQSMSRKGNCIDNCIMESFFGTFKNEMFYGNESKFEIFEDLKQAIGEYIDYYNNKRIKSKTKWMPPSKFREASMLAL